MGHIRRTVNYVAEQLDDDRLAGTAIARVLTTRTDMRRDDAT
ncbi:hypothetical protein QTQ03_01290 [Micromonospora sp. WMMA1363]|nr:hypothetical protein [Micromonospora sp. WMMA1363]MDM4718284.1 hypothetical protein [Micromonospora sp. WMMA1363]